jgi:hypothetical protein
MYLPGLLSTCMGSRWLQQCLSQECRACAGAQHLEAFSGSFLLCPEHADAVLSSSGRSRSPQDEVSVKMKSLAARGAQPCLLEHPTPPLSDATLHPPCLPCPPPPSFCHHPSFLHPAGLLPPTSGTSTYPRDLTSAFMAAAMQQQQHGQLMAHTPHTPTHQQQALLPLLTPPQLTPSASLAAQGVLQGPTAATTAAAAAAAATAAAAPLAAPHTAMHAMDALNMNRGRALTPQPAPPPASAPGFNPPGAALLNPDDGDAAGLNSAGDALQQLLSDPALMDAVLRSDMGHSNTTGAHTAAAAPAGARASLQGFQTTGVSRVSFPKFKMYQNKHARGGRHAGCVSCHGCVALGWRVC